MNKKKLKAHIVTLPRWFATPFFGSAMLLGVVLAGGQVLGLSTLFAFICCALLMASAHSLNSYLDYAWTGLDKGEEGDRSATKEYAAGCGLISAGILSENEVYNNAVGWFMLSLIPGVFLFSIVDFWIFIPIVLAPVAAIWYSAAKFNYTHELALASGVVIAVLLGAISAGTGNWLKPLLIALPISMIFSFAGLALDEWPDAEANLKKGVKSIAYKVWEFKIDLGTYLMTWVGFAYTFQVFLISIGYLKPMTALTFLAVPAMIGTVVFLKSNIEYSKIAHVFVISAALYPMLLLIGQAIG